MSCCANCGEEWPPGTYSKFKVLSLTSPYTARKAFPHLHTPAKHRVCELCKKDLTLRTIWKRRTGKRTWPTHTPKRVKRLVPDSTPTKAPPSKRASLESCPSSTEGTASESTSVTVEATISELSFKERAKAYIDASQYVRAFRALISSSTAAKAAMHTVAVQEVRGAMARSKSKGTSPISSLKSPVTKERLEAFSWKAINEEASQTLPFLVRILEVALPSTKILARQVTKGPQKERRFLTASEALNKRDARLSLLLGIIFFSRNPRQYSFIQAMLSIDFWLQGVSHTIVRSLNFLGVSQGVDAARNRIDSIRAGYDQKVVSWRLDAEASYGSKTQRRLSYGPAPAPPPAGYSLCFDNVQFQAHRKHQQKGVHSDFIISSLAYATSHRVRAAPSVVASLSTGTPSAEMDISVFLPQESDFAVQRADLVIAVKHTLVLHLATFARSKKRIPWTTSHAYSYDMIQKSDIISLGVIQGNPSSTPETIDVLDNLMTYVPVVGNRALPVRCHGDGGTVDTIIKAKRGRVLSSSPSHSFRALLETPQEFHKEGLLMQDIMDTFFSQKSRVDRGTLYNIKEMFGHKSARAQVMSNFQHVWDLLMFATEGMTVLLTMKFLGIDDPDSIPDDFPVELAKQDSYLDRLAMSIVDRVWQQPSKEDIHMAGEMYRTHRTMADFSTTDPYPYCHCHAEKDDTLIQCCNSTCQHEWFHLSCLEPPLDEAPPLDEDWYCSPACRDADGYIFCSCKSRLPLDISMVQCFKKQDCQHSEWYHPSCLGKENADELPEHWCCSDQCALAEQQDDGVLEHSLALLWKGLNLAVRRNAVREGDGERMLKYWRLDMVQFWESNHPRISHTFLAYTGGFLHPAVAHEMIWNRTVNSGGRKSGNISLDQMNEFLNNEYKDMIRHCHGRYTPTQIQRCSQMIGPFKRELVRLFQMCPAEDQLRKTTPKYREDVASFLLEYKEDALFDYCPPRSHSAFPHYKRAPDRMRNPVRLGERLKELSLQMDNYRTLND